MLASGGGLLLVVGSLGWNVSVKRPGRRLAGAHPADCVVSREARVAHYAAQAERITQAQACCCPAITRALMQPGMATWLVVVLTFKLGMRPGFRP
ncbi:MAG: hypothetical protein IPH37_16885 [Burkholderiales bacterium]|nr:hypothetical protein [Burkholderiales bacterium]